MKQGKDNVTTDWRKEHHNLQTKANRLGIHISALETRIFHINEWRERLQAICRKVGWFLIALMCFMMAFDKLANQLLGTAVFSFSYSEGIGIGQILSIMVFGLLGGLLLVMGYYRSKK